MRSNWKTCAAVVCLFLATAICGEPAGAARGQGGKGSKGAQSGKDRQGDKGARDKQDGQKEIFLTSVPWFNGNVILGRPTDRSVTVSVMMREAARIRIVHGLSGQGLWLQTGPFELKPSQPMEIALDNLEPNSTYEYRILNVETGKPLLPEGGNGCFRTCRAPGSSFVFTLQADSHLDENCLPELYTACLKSALADKPDFHIDLGDTFMTGKHESRETAALQYVAQRYYFGLIGYAAPVFLVIGNHDGEEAAGPGATGGDGLAVWSAAQRKRLFPNPAPDVFYTGNLEKHPYAGLLQDYYAWTWGDALFVALDPYWASQSTRGGKEPWNMTLGKTQCDWLVRTLRASKAKYKFIFIHQLVGGLGQSGRGGAEAAPLFEWGGREKDGENTFISNRPGWEKPIHSILVETGVTAVFHGHDHFFVHQELDGIVYQLVPQPAHRGEGGSREVANYGYLKGDIRPGSGYLRVTVSSVNARVDYVRAQRSANGSKGPASSVAYSYAIAARKEGAIRQ